MNDMAFLDIFALRILSDPLKSGVEGLLGSFNAFRGHSEPGGGRAGRRSPGV